MSRPPASELRSHCVQIAHRPQPDPRADWRHWSASLRSDHVACPVPTQNGDRLMDGNLRTKFKVAPVLAAVGLLAGFLALPVGAVGAAAPQITVIAQGLDNPRGIAFGPEGALYVVEAGRGGAGPCTPGELFGAPICYGPSGAVTRVLNGDQRRVATGLGSFAHADGGFAFGPHDIAIGGEGAAYVTVGGCFAGVTPAQGLCGGLFNLR